MTSPAVWILATTIGEDTTLTAGMAVLLVTVTLALGEARWHVAHLREWRREHEAKDVAKEARISALEARTSRTDERVDNVLTLLTEVRADVKLLLRDRGRDAA